MNELETRLESLRRRRNIGLALLFVGVVPMLAMMIWIVAIQTPEPWMLFATVGCWSVFFIGKTLMKTATLTAAKIREGNTGEA